MKKIKLLMCTLLFTLFASYANAAYNPVDSGLNIQDTNQNQTEMKVLEQHTDLSVIEKEETIIITNSIELENIGYPKSTAIKLDNQKAKYFSSSIITKDFYHIDGLEHLGIHAIHKNGIKVH